MTNWRIIEGDCIEAMQGMDPCSVDAVVTDPPYGLSFMGKGWDKGVPGVEFWAEALRVAKPGAHLLAFGGTRMVHRLACAIEDAGWEIRDRIHWVYGSGFPKSHNLKDDWQGWGTTLKPAVEPIILARKPFKGTVAANVLEHGTGGLNIDGCRVGTDAGWSYPNGRGGSGWHGRESLSNNLTEPMKADKGRWPSNLIHDGSDEVTGLFPTTQSGSIKPHHKRTTSKTKNAYGERSAPAETTHGDSGSAARFFYCAKASKKDRDEGLDSMENRASGSLNMRTDAHARLNGNETTPRKNHHPTVKPTDLMAYLCRLVTPDGGTVLDPFMGSGSTGKAAVQLGLGFIGIELNPEYAATARERIGRALNPTTHRSDAVGDSPLFTGATA